MEKWRPKMYFLTFGNINKKEMGDEETARGLRALAALVEDSRWVPKLTGSWQPSTAPVLGHQTSSYGLGAPGTHMVLTGTCRPNTHTHKTKINFTKRERRENHCPWFFFFKERLCSRGSELQLRIITVVFSTGCILVWGSDRREISFWIFMMFSQKILINYLALNIHRFLSTLGFSTGLRMCTD